MSTGLHGLSCSSMIGWLNICVNEQLYLTKLVSPLLWNVRKVRLGVCVINFTLIYFSFILFGSGVVWRSQPCDRAETCPGSTGRMDGCIINELHETQWYKTMCDFLKISANFNLDDSRRTCHTCAEPCKTSHAKDFLKKVPGPPQKVKV